MTDELKKAAEEYAFNNAEDGGEYNARYLGFIAGAEWKDRSLNWIRDLVKAAIKKPEEAQGILERIDRMLNKEEQK